jgi:hypothetical protein
MEIDITLVQFPEHILEEIFAFVPKKNNLRLVCKTFKRIIDYSANLMKRRWLKVDNALDDDSSDIDYQFQKIAVLDLNIKVFNWMLSYQHKDRITTILINCGEDDLVKSEYLVQYILSSFNSMRTLFFHSGTVTEPIDLIKLIPNKSSKLETLYINNWLDYDINVLDMFTNIPTIKNLFIYEFGTLQFPTEVKWQLEKLIVPNIREREFDEDNCMQFLESQQTIKKLMISDFHNSYANNIMRSLPNLEHLTVDLVDGEEIDSSRLLSNSRLQSLTIVGLAEKDVHNYTAVLTHYNRIKYLDISFSFSNAVLGSLSWKFEYVTHLRLHDLNFFHLLKNGFPSLKVLVLEPGDEGGILNVAEISNNIAKNVEKLSLFSFYEENVFEFLDKFSNLSQLNLSSLLIDESQKSFATTIDEFLDAAPQLKCLGMEKSILKKRNLTYGQLLDQVSNKRVVFKIYSHFMDMIEEDWGRYESGGCFYFAM